MLSVPATGELRKSFGTLFPDCLLVDPGSPHSRRLTAHGLPPFNLKPKAEALAFLTAGAGAERVAGGVYGVVAEPLVPTKLGRFEIDRSVGLCAKFGHALATNGVEQCAGEDRRSEMEAPSLLQHFGGSLSEGFEEIGDGPA